MLFCLGKPCRCHVLYVVFVCLGGATFIVCFCWAPASRHHLEAVLCHSPEHQHLLEGTFTCVSSHPGMPLDHLACIPGPRETINSGETVLGQLPSPQHCTETENRLKSTQSWDCLCGSLAWGAGFQSGTVLGVDKVAVREWRPVDTTFVLTFSLALAHQYLPARGLHPCLALRFL